MPNVVLTMLAREKLQEYLSEEPSETVVRLLVEDDGRFGLSLDEATDDDATFEVEGLTFVIEQTHESTIEGLRVDYLDQGASSGFSLSGGRAPRAGGDVVVQRVDETPNPNARKFVLAFARAADGQTWTRARHGEAPQEIQELLELPGVASVFEHGDFVTITRGEGVDWEQLEAKVKGVLNALFERPVEAPQAGAAPGADAPLLERVRHFVKTDVAPFLQADGGEISILGIDGGTVKVELRGACGTCPSSALTLKGGVERRLRAEFGEIETLEVA